MCLYFAMVTSNMFDWNDEEISNLIWEETGDGDDHIVPYPEGTEGNHKKKEQDQEDSAIKLVEDRNLQEKDDSHDKKTETSSSMNLSRGISSGLLSDSWADLSTSNAVCNQDFLGTEASKSLAERVKYDPLAENAELDKDPESFVGDTEIKEQGDFTDYGWANIGSFEDLDRMFSNDETMFSNASFNNANELWSSSKDVANSPVKSFSMSVDSHDVEPGGLSSACDYLEMKPEYDQGDGKLYNLGHGKTNNSASFRSESQSTFVKSTDVKRDTDKPIIRDQGNFDYEGNAPYSPFLASDIPQAEYVDKAFGRNKQLKSQKKLIDGKNSGTILHGMSDSQYTSGDAAGQHEQLLPPSIAQSCIIQERQPQAPEYSYYQHISDAYLSTADHVANTFLPVPLMSPKSRKRDSKNVLSHYDASPGLIDSKSKLKNVNKSLTPQEKIEKLRRRQQMQAMIAIEKQQQQLGQHVSNHSIPQDCPQENQFPQIGVADSEANDLCTLPSCDQSSPMEHDDSNTVSAPADDCWVEETILYQLEDIISKLDMKTRMCIRDSLSRLAQNAAQRNYPPDPLSSTIGRKEQDTTAKELNIRNRQVQTGDIERGTNPIDRTVAHLLFHRPIEQSIKPSVIPESSLPTKPPSECKSMSVASLLAAGYTESSNDGQVTSISGSETPSGTFLGAQQVDQVESNPCLESSENISKNGHLCS